MLIGAKWAFGVRSAIAIWGSRGDRPVVWPETTTLMKSPASPRAVDALAPSTEPELVLSLPLGSVRDRFVRHIERRPQLCFSLHGPVQRQQRGAEVVADLRIC